MDSYGKIQKEYLQFILLSTSLRHGCPSTPAYKYRAKIDVSRTETVKSARVIHYDRPKVADEAAQYITHNRRGTNAQMYGEWNKKIHYQVAFGDGVYSGKLKDATGSSSLVPVL